jgi:OOP family OmpA-OmpF porin
MHRKPFSKKYILPALLLAGVVSLPPSAQAIPPGFYVGLGLGAANDVVLEQNSTGVKLFGGYNFNRYIGLEIAYVNLGDNYCCDQFGNPITQDGVSYELAGYLPISPTIDLFAKAGMYNWTVSTSNSYYYGYTYYYSSTSGTDPVYSVGITSQLNQKFSIRGEYQNFTNILGGDVNMVSVSGTYHF